MRISDWSSDVCSSDLTDDPQRGQKCWPRYSWVAPSIVTASVGKIAAAKNNASWCLRQSRQWQMPTRYGWPIAGIRTSPHRHRPLTYRSEEHTSELQSLMRISYAVFCLKKKKKTKR